jgi:hypothetical protein
MRGPERCWSVKISLDASEIPELVFTEIGRSS